MIISHKYRFIFIKTRKTAGTSLEIALGDQCGPEDVITRISMEDEKVRRKISKRGAQNYRLPLSSYTGGDWKKLLVKGKFKRFENHDTAMKIQTHLSAEQWNSYYKFCFERNPWDKMVSHYYWKKEVYNLQSFQEYIDKGLNGEITGFFETINSREQYSSNGAVVVDKIYKFEDLDEALAEITDKLGLETPLKMPDYRAKGAHRQKNKHYRDLLSPLQADWIANQFKVEIDRLNYSY